jgi:hypothetical protein
MDRYVNFAFEVPWDTCLGTSEAAIQGKNSGGNLIYLSDCAPQHEAIFHAFRLCVKHF